ncbi:MAG: hypothetical protein MUP11_12735, partial [Anaerolineales bacterium]|nr:hypothetical protein [Anaerolineales bacterium]
MNIAIFHYQVGGTDGVSLEIEKWELIHDFYWERVDGFSLNCAGAAELVDKYLPPQDPEIKHIVINSLAQKELLERKGILSRVVPNVFDFSGPDWEVDEYNSDLRQEIGLAEG